MSSSDDLGRSRRVTDAVREQYEVFPYPPVSIHQEVNHFSLGYSYIFANYARTRTYLSDLSGKALVAGCGTGYEIHLVRASNPDFSSITGVDISRKSIEIANERIHYHQLHGCSAQVGNLLDLRTLPDGQFNFIASYGVVHHTAHPVLALKNLNNKLAPGGIMCLMLYNRYGRSPIYSVREIMDIMGINALNFDRRLEFVSNLINSAQDRTRLSGHVQANSRYYEKIENFVDNFLHAQDVGYGISEIPPLLDEAGLTFIDVIPRGRDWLIQDVVSPDNHEFYKAYEKLDRVQQLRIIELINPARHTENVFWCARKEEHISYDVSLDSDDDWLLSDWQVNPLFLTYASIEIPGKSATLNELLADGSKSFISEQINVRWKGFLGNTGIYDCIELVSVLQPIISSPKTGKQIYDMISTNIKSLRIFLDLLKELESARVVLRYYS